MLNLHLSAVKYSWPNLHKSSVSLKLHCTDWQECLVETEALWCHSAVRLPAAHLVQSVQHIPTVSHTVRLTLIQLKQSAVLATTILHNMSCVLQVVVEIATAVILKCSSFTNLQLLCNGTICTVMHGKNWTRWVNNHVKNRFSTGFCDKLPVKYYMASWLSWGL